MRRLRITEPLRAGAVMAVLALGCRGETVPPMMAEVRAVCPMVVEGARVDLVEFDRGSALVFTTDRDVADLVRRVDALSRMYQRHSGRGRMMWHHAGDLGPHHRPGRLRGSMPPVRAEVERVEGGARIVMTPVNERELVSMREHLFAHRERMASGQCWLLVDDVKGESDD